METFRGISVSPGIVVAQAFCLQDDNDSPPSADAAAADVQHELTRFDQACESAGSDLRALVEKVAAEVGIHESEIFRAHLLMLHDRSLIAKVKSNIVERHLDAAVALAEACDEYSRLFADIKDEYLRERIVDLKDVVARVQGHLANRHPAELPKLEGPIVLVAKEIYPSHAVNLRQLEIAGIVTERGGGTSHVAIIARSLGIPAVSGIDGLLHHVKTGDLLVLDAREGRLVVNPGPEAQAAYRKLHREFFDFKDYLITNRDLPAVTTDGQAIDLLANVNNVTDARAAAEMGAIGVGLYRTEYIFLTHPTIPDENEQYATYRQMLEAAPRHMLTIRTLDLGGDKTVPYLGDHKESNPFMGWRSIRLSLDHPDFFRHQVRAILRAGAHGNVRMMFPMIATVDELRRANRIVAQVREQLHHEGLPFDREMKVGIMVEVPAAALCIEQLLEHTDYVSIGTNDLVQYLMAADRDNPKVAHLCDPLSPAALRVLRDVIAACDEAKVPVTVCGEMAGRPAGVLALLAFGLRSFSMSPAFVPVVKELVHSVSVSKLNALADELLRRRSGKQVRNFLTHVLREVNPRQAMLEHS